MEKLNELRNNIPERLSLTWLNGTLLLVDALLIGILIGLRLSERKTSRSRGKETAEEKAE